MIFKQIRKYLSPLLCCALIFPIFTAFTSFAAAATWGLSDKTEIFWVKTDSSNIEDKDLETQIHLFSSELADQITKTSPLPISYGDISKAGANDIILILDSSLDIPAEGYEVTIVNKSVRVSASDADGLFYGCRYLIKQLLLKGKVSPVSDAPHVAERAVSLDNGRKYFSAAWIKKLIREISWANMNTLVLHFSEDMGLGIESKLYPWLAGRDGTLCVQEDLGSDYDTRYLTQKEVIDIINYAKRYHVQIIPSLDTPGHMNYIVKKFNEKCAKSDFSFEYDGKTYTAKAGTEIGNYYHYKGKTAIVQGSRNTEYSRGIDISNNVAVAFTKSLIEEYAKLFAQYGSTGIDIGGDELLGWGDSVDSSVSKWKQLDHWKAYAQKRTGNSEAVAYDAFLLYMNDLNDLVRDLGYSSVRMWNDDVLRSSDTGWTGVVQLDTAIDIWFWQIGTNRYNDYTKAGYAVYNIVGAYCYYAMLPAYYNGTVYADAANPKTIYNEWSPYIFSTDGTGNAWQSNKAVLGGAFAIWCDNPSLKTPNQILSAIRPLIRANGAKSWDPNAEDTVDYSTFVSNWEAYGNPTNSAATGPEVYIVADRTALEAAVAEYASVSAGVYTSNSYNAYTSAVNAGRTILAADKPQQADVDSATQVIVKAKGDLIEVADYTELQSLITEFDQMNGSIYTNDSFEAYSDAVDAGRPLLETDETPQADVDAAAETIIKARNALTIIIVNTSELDAEIAKSERLDRAEYTGDTFAVYINAVYKGKLLLTTEGYSQSDVDACVTDIRTAFANIIPVEESAVTCILGGISRGTRAYVNKTITLTVSTDKALKTVGLRVFDDTGKEITFIRSALNTNQAKRDIHTVAFKATSEDVGARTYTAYVVLEDGTTLSKDFIEFIVEVVEP